MGYLLGYFAILGIFLLIMLAVCVVAYIFYGISHSRALKHMGYANPWAAWVPFYNFYALADCTKQSEFKLGTLVIPMNIFKWAWAAAFIVSFIPVIGSLAMLAILCIYQGWCYGLMYAVTERTPIDNTRTIGYVSGVFVIIPIVKFMQLSKEIE